ncbi:ABC transporter permease subunit [Haliovirga abyssi]|uniref:ABC transmembrane type-1 domain-containing protein n=1 Tax=Haliovirga abyssi TaxID=2996794 RepID=A0AAU9D4S3_9FUSO|nr:ABC transporter permease subunit [Haliovirga abyssi]BDU50959.1 hypothetical protein HLVA_15280 [Haliovirga abyssi]
MNLNGKRSKKFMLFFLLFLVFSFLLRWHATIKLGIDFDENVYVPIAKKYADYLKLGDFYKIITFKENIEHPILIKLIYGIGIYLASLFGMDVTTFIAQINISRIISVLFSVAHLALIYLINPIAGIFMAVSTWQIKYSAEAMLDSGATFFATLAILAFIKMNGKKFDKYFLISAMAIGMAFASKYITATTAITILPFLFIKTKKNRKLFFIYGIVAFATFFIFDPILWTDTFHRLKESILFHKNYSTGEFVKKAGFPFYMQMIWLLQSVPWKPFNAFFIRIDSLIFIGAVFGAKALYKKNRILGTWFFVNAIFLIIYPTKWPQYTLIFIPVMSIAAAEFYSKLYIKLKELYIEKIEDNIENKSGRKWLYVIIFGWSVILYSIYNIIISVMKAQNMVKSENSVMPFIFIMLGLAVVFIGTVKLIKFMTKEKIEKYKKASLAYKFIFPAILGTIILTLFPVILSIYLSFTDYSLETGYANFNFIELGNYMWILLNKDSIFWNVAFMTLWWSIWNILFGLGLGLGLALILNKKTLRFRRFYISILMITWAIPSYITAYMWKIILNKKYGIFNMILAPFLSIFGIGKVDWLNRSFIKVDDVIKIPILRDIIGTVFATQGYFVSLPFFSATVVNIWLSFPFLMIVSLSGLKSISDEYYEASSIDGATKWQQFRHITLPLLKPVIMPGVILSIIWTFNQFNVINILRSRKSNMTILMELNYWPFREGWYGYAAAFSIIVFIILMFYVKIVMRFFKEENYKKI